MDALYFHQRLMVTVDSGHSQAHVLMVCADMHIHLLVLLVVILWLIFLRIILLRLQMELIPVEVEQELNVHSIRIIYNRVILQRKH